MDDGRGAASPATRPATGITGGALRTDPATAAAEIKDQTEPTTADGRIRPAATGPSSEA